MPKSKRHYKRKMKLRERDEKANKWADRKLKEFHELPEEEKIAFLTRWKNRHQKQTVSGDEVELETASD